MRTLFLILITAFSLHAQVPVTGKSFRIMNSDSTHGEINNTEYVTSAGYYRYKENGVWYYRASTADIAANAATASNGLTKVGNDIRLGGSITQNTDIIGAFNLNLGTSGNRINQFSVNSTGNHNFNTSNGNINFTATLGSSTLTSGTTIAINSGTNTTISPTGTFAVSTNSTSAISGGAGVSLNSNSGAVNFITNSISRLQIDNDGSWTINSTPGTAGQALVTNGAVGTPTWQTVIGGTLSATQVGYGSGANTLTGEAAFTYNATTNTLGVDNITSVNGLSLNATGTSNLTLNVATGGQLSASAPDVIISATNSTTVNGVNVLSLTSTSGNVVLTPHASTGDIYITNIPDLNNSTTQILGRNSGTGKLEYKDASTFTTAPAGSNTQIQYNNAGAFGADAELVYDATTNILTLATDIILNGTADAISISGSGGNTSLLVSGLTRQTGSQDIGISTTGVNIRLNPRIGGGTSYIIIENIPTSCAGAPTGAIANISGVLNICP